LSQARQAIGYTNYIFFSVTVIAVLVFLLDSTRSCGQTIDFCTISIFLAVFTISLGMLVLLGALIQQPVEYVASHGRGNNTGYFRYKDVTFFFLQDINVRQLILIPAGLLGVFLTSYLAIIADNPIAGIFVSGIIMGGIFLYSNSAMPVILIHGAYNAIVVLLRSQQLTLFNTSPINIPDVSFDVFLGQQTINEMLTQIVLVAPAEELFKIFMMTTFIIVMKAKFDYSGLGSRIIAMIIAVIVWSLYHTQIAIQV
jgi:membrane protease YdiL (CAAX protease family)